MAKSKSRNGTASRKPSSLGVVSAWSRRGVAQKKLALDYVHIDPSGIEEVGSYDLVTTRLLRVVKYRGSSHGVSTGVPDLDEMMGGKGYFRTSTILSPAPPGRPRARSLRTWSTHGWSATEAGISSLIDTWLELRDVERHGEQACDAPHFVLRLYVAGCAGSLAISPTFRVFSVHWIRAQAQMKRSAQPRDHPDVEIETLRSRLAEAEESLDAIRLGKVDALMVSTPAGPRVFTLEGADHRYRRLVETMSEGALIVSAASVVLYSNAAFARMVARKLETVVGHHLADSSTRPRGRFVQAWPPRHARSVRPKRSRCEAPPALPSSGHARAHTRRVRGAGGDLVGLAGRLRCRGGLRSPEASRSRSGRGRGRGRGRGHDRGASARR